MLETELTNLLDKAFGSDERLKDALLVCRGFSGEKPINNAQASRLLGVLHSTHGNKSFTRERVRLLLVAAIGKEVDLPGGGKGWDKDSKGNEYGILPYIESTNWRSKSLEKAFALLDSLAPISVDRATDALKDSGLSEGLFHVEALLEVARTIELPCRLTIEKYGRKLFLARADEKTTVATDKLGNTKQVPVCDGILKVATKKVVANGACSVDELLELIPPRAGLSARSAKALKEHHLALIRDLVETAPGFMWLDTAAQWFFFNRPCRNRVATKIQQLFAVVQGELPVSELVDAIDQSYAEYRGSHRVIPDSVLVSLAEIVADCKTIQRDGKQYLYSTSRETLQETLTENMKHIADFLARNPMSREHAMRKELVEERGVISGLGLLQRVFYSPFAKRVSPGVYVLRGQQFGDNGQPVIKEHKGV